MTRFGNRVILSALGLLVAVSFGPTTVLAEDFIVLVNAENQYQASVEEMKVTVRQLYLFDTRSWPGGVNARPFSRDKGDPAQDALLGKILDMTETEHDSHWAKKKQTTGDAPPRSVASDGILLRLIARDAGSVAIVSKAKADTLPPTVRVLFEFSS